MKSCVSPHEAVDPTSTSSPPWLVHSWSVCWGGASQHYSRPVEFPVGEEQLRVKTSHKKRLNKEIPQKLPGWSQMSGLRCMRAVVDEGGNESQGCSKGPRWMVRRALSRVSYRHTVNHSPHFFPVWRTAWRETTKLQLRCFFLLRLKVSMFHNVFTQFYNSLTLWDPLE